jgi:hypothetical protein
VTESVGTHFAYRTKEVNFALPVGEYPPAHRQCCEKTSVLHGASRTKTHHVLMKLGQRLPFAPRTVRQTPIRELGNVQFPATMAGDDPAMDTGEY